MKFEEEKLFKSVDRQQTDSDHNSSSSGELKMCLKHMYWIVLKNQYYQQKMSPL